MAKKKSITVSQAALDAAHEQAEQLRQKLAHKPSPAELLTPQERADAAPFYFVLREFIRQLRAARDAAGLTLAQVSEKCGMAVESLSRLETGAQTNPTWKTLGSYAAAVGRRPSLEALSLVEESSPVSAVNTTTTSVTFPPEGVFGSGPWVATRFGTVGAR